MVSVKIIRFWPRFSIIASLEPSYSRLHTDTQSILSSPTLLWNWLIKRCSKALRQYNRENGLWTLSQPVCSIVFTCDIWMPKMCLVSVVRFLPDWAPGTSFKQLARSWRKTTDGLMERPHRFAKQRMVGEVFWPRLPLRLIFPASIAGCRCRTDVVRFLLHERGTNPGWGEHHQIFCSITICRRIGYSMSFPLRCFNLL